MRWPLLLALIALGVPAMAPGVGAHALLLQADPGNGAALQRAPQVVTLTFAEDPAPSLSRVRVLSTSGMEVSRGPAYGVPGRPNVLRVDLGPLPAGVYTVTWR